MLFKYIVLLQCFNMCKNCRLKLLVITNITFKRKYNKAHSPYVQEYIHCIWIWKIKLRITYLIAKVYSLGSHFFFSFYVDLQCCYISVVHPHCGITALHCPSSRIAHILHPSTRRLL